MKVKKLLAVIMFALLCAVILQPQKAEAAVTFENIQAYVVDDMRDYDQVIGLSWKLDWKLDKDAGVTEQKRYAKFTLAQDSLVRIKMSTVDRKSFAVQDYFRLYANETMAVPLTDNGIDYGSGDDSFLLKAGTYYVECGSKLYMSSTSNHSTKIMIGAVPADKAVEITQTASSDRKKMTIAYNQKFSSNLGTVKWCEGKVTSMPYSANKLEGTNAFTVDKNGWYTLCLEFESSVAFNQGVEHYVYINVTGIGEGAKKGVTYKSGNLKYKLVKKGFDGTGTVMVTGMVKQKSSVTIPKTVKIKGQTYKVVKINSKSFYKKSKLKKITIQSTTITSIGKNAFKGINKKAVIKVPKSKYSKYKKMLTSKTGFVKKTMKIKK